MMEKILLIRGCLKSIRINRDPPQPPLQRGAKFLKIPLEKGDLGGSAGVRSHTKKFSNNLLY